MATDPGVFDCITKTARPFALVNELILFMKSKFSRLDFIVTSMFFKGWENLLKRSTVMML